MSGMGKGPLRIAIEDFLNTFKMGEILHKWLEDVVQKIEDNALGIYEKLCASLGIEDFLPPNLTGKGMRKEWKKADETFVFTYYT